MTRQLKIDEVTLILATLKDAYDKCTHFAGRQKLRMLIRELSPHGVQLTVRIPEWEE